MNNELGKYLCIFLTFIIIITVIFTVFFSNNLESVTAANYRFVKILDDGQYEIILDTNTRVMYLQSTKGVGYQGYGGLTVLVDSEGHPLLYKGEI